MVVLRKLSPSFSISLLLHAVFFVAWFFAATHSRVSDGTKESKYILIDVDPLPKAKVNPKTKNQVVQTEKATKTREAAPDAYLGEQTQRVDRQMVSMPKTGTAPKTAEMAPPKADPKEVAPAEKPAVKTPVLTATGALAKFGIAISADKNDSPKPKKEANPIEEGALSAQARGEYVKGFKEGEQTMLNTREFVFYGYFQRIRDRLDRAWERSLRERLAKYFYRGRQLASETDYMTQLLVSLDKNGRITKVQIIGNSGTTDLDEAATKAFNDAGPFPNPPSGLVDPKGQVFVRWDFVLKT